MSHTKLHFGKHKGKTLPQIIFQDLDYFVWAIEENIFNKNQNLQREAEILHEKIKNIKIPGDKSEDYSVEYTIHPTTGSYCDFELVEKSRPLHEGDSLTLRKNCIDLTIVRNTKTYDKSGSDLIIKKLKGYYFDNERYKMTKKRSESFFDNENNFIR